MCDPSNITYGIYWSRVYHGWLLLITFQQDINQSYNQSKQAGAELFLAQVDLCVVKVLIFAYQSLMHIGTKLEINPLLMKINCQAQPQLQLNLWLRLVLFLE